MLMELYGENVLEVPISERQIGPMSLLELPEHTLRLGASKKGTQMTQVHWQEAPARILEAGSGARLLLAVSFHLQLSK